MKKIILMISALFLMGTMASNTAAQNLDDAEGLESAYSRVYSTGASTSAPAAASSDSTPVNLEGEATFSTVEIIGFTFDSEDNAKQFVSDMRTGIEEAVGESDADANAEITDIAVDKDGFFAVMTVPNTGENAIALFADGNQVFLLDVMDPDRETASKLVNDIAEFIVDAETDSDHVTLHEDGSSTGGVYDRMPASGDDLVKDLSNVTDKAIKEASN